MSKDKLIRKDKKKKRSKLEKKLDKATDKVIHDYGDVLKKLGKS